MKIKFIRQTKSIKPFLETEINNFAIFTGLNGSGKTHILEGINEGNIQIDEITKDQVVYFNFSSFLLQNQPASNLTSIAQLKASAWLFLQQKKKNFIQFDTQIKKCLKNNVQHPYNASDEDVITDSNYKNIIAQILAFLISQNQNNLKQIGLLKSVLFNIDTYFSEITEADFIEIANFDYLDYQLLNNLSEIFIEHQSQIVYAKANKECGGSGASEEKINKLEKNAPWNFINNIFEEYNLDHRVDRPNFGIRELTGLQYQVKLQINGSEINFSDLSSGEKILVALAITVFQDKKSNFPKLLLLDEIDATLHPSMIVKTLNVINNVFIGNGSKVIMATHSPSTIAHALNESIYEIKKGTVQKKILKIDKTTALEILTDGFATLDKGLRLFDSLSQKKLSIFTEGKNTEYIKKALQLKNPDLLKKVEIITGAEGNSGDSQLKILFDFFSKIKHDKKVMFIWDCDCIKDNKINSLKEVNNTIPYIFDQNSSNSKVTVGIENLFGIDLFTEDFYTKNNSTDSYGARKITEKFNKNAFSEWILENGTVENFKNFDPLITRIEEILI